LIARVLDEDKIVLVSILDLISAFDIVNIDLLLKILKIIGLPSDLIQLISVWLKKKFYHVSIDGINSTLCDILLGAFRGSFLGPIVFTIFVAPLNSFLPLQMTHSSPGRAILFLCLLLK
jgi:hypothetical protein